MCDSITFFLSYLKPIISDLDVVKKELNEIKKELNNVQDFLEFINDDVYRVGKYENQEFIIQKLEEIDYDTKYYQGMIYLLESKSEHIQILPQYNDAVNYIKKIIAHFKELNNQLSYRVDILDDVYDYKFVANKYYNILNSDKVFVEDTEEFNKFLTNTQITNYNKIKILSYVIKENVCYYEDEQLDEVDKEQDLVKVQEIIYQNRNLFGNKYNELTDMVSEHVNLTHSLKEMINENVLDKVNIQNIILCKRIWLAKKIMNCYKSCEFAKVSRYTKEYDNLMELRDKVLNINNKKEIIRIIKGGY